jgi:hypothetical protein
LADYKWSSYLTYAYGRKAERWLKAELILSQFQGNKLEKNRAYRKKVQEYSKEEKQIWEDFSHGLFFGTRDFIDKMRDKYLPKEPHKEKPQQRDILRSNDINKQLKEAAKIIGFNLKGSINIKRLSGDEKTKRDLLINVLWETGLYKNEEIGKVFGVSYSSISKSVSAIREQIKADKKIRVEYEKLNSQFKI